MRRRNRAQGGGDSRDVKRVAIGGLLLVALAGCGGPTIESGSSAESTTVREQLYELSNPWSEATGAVIDSTGRAMCEAKVRGETAESYWNWALVTPTPEKKHEAQQFWDVAVGAYCP